MSNKNKENGYKIDFAKQTFTMTKEFADKANNPSSKEFKILATVMGQFPGLTVLNRTHRKAKTVNKNKGLTYEAMDKYIKTFDNKDELLEMFETVKDASKVQTNCYKYVKEWFLYQFPDYKEFPTFSEDNTRYIVVKNYPLNEVEQPLSKAS